jgi:hypothetical protein
MKATHRKDLVREYKEREAHWRGSIGAEKLFA